MDRRRGMKAGMWALVAAAVAALLALGGGSARPVLASSGGAIAFTPPPARSGASMATDLAHGTVVLFGGFGATGTLNDTWVWNGSAWRQAIAPTCSSACPNSPIAREAASMAFDPVTSSVVLFGGENSPFQPLNDTWLWDGSSWSRVVAANCTSACPSSPPARFGASLATDAATHTVVLFGGVNSSNQLFNDTWLWNGSTWSQAFSPGCTTTCPNSPPPHQFAGMAYDAVGGGIVLFGGADIAGHGLNDTWFWDGTLWRQKISLGCTNACPASPAPRDSAGMATDPASRTTVLFGGLGVTDVLNDTWLWDGSSWTQANTAGGTGPPPPRLGANLAEDPTNGGLVLFGGLGDAAGPFQSLNDTWLWNGTGWRATCGISTTPASPPCVLGLNPSFGGAGVTVTVTGSGFSGATNVNFGQIAANTFFQVPNDTTLTAVTPPAAAGTILDVVVETPAGRSTTSSADQYSYHGPPTVSGISPPSGPVAGGTTVTITGTNFSTTVGETTVQFGTAQAQIASGGPPQAEQPAVGLCRGEACLAPTDPGDPPDASRLTPHAANATVACPQTTLCYAISPPGSGTVDVRVTVGGLESATASADQFTYLSAPSVAGITPTAGVPAGGTTVTIQGSNFSTTPGATGVSFGGNAATSVSCASASQCYAVSPAGTGTVDLTVTVGSQTSPTSANDKFSYAPAPQVAAVSPRAGSTKGGTTVTLSGSGFTGATAVAFGQTLATNLSVGGDGSLSVTAPAGPAGSVVDVRVTTAVGTSAIGAADFFEYLQVGDVNADLAVTSVDALCVLRQVGKLGGTQACPQPLPGNPDVNGDGQVTSVDALCVLRIVATLGPTQACPVGGTLTQPTADSVARDASAPAVVALTLRTDAGVGGRQTVTLVADTGATSLGAWTIDLLFDPKSVAVGGCDAGEGSVCNTGYQTGVVRLSGAAAGGLGGSQVLATLTLIGTNKGHSGSRPALSLRPQTLTDPEGTALGLAR